MNIVFIYKPDEKLHYINTSLKALRTAATNEDRPADDTPVYFLAVNDTPIKRHVATFRDMMALLNDSEKLKAAMNSEEDETDSRYYLLFFENSECNSSSTVRHFRTKQEAREAMLRMYKFHKAEVGVPENNSEYDGEDHYVCMDDDSITIQDGEERFRWEIGKVEFE